MALNHYAKKSSNLLSRYWINSSIPDNLNQKLLMYSTSTKSYPKWPNDWLPFQWESKEQKPIFFDTGDQIEGLDLRDPDKLLPQYEDIEILKNAPEPVRRQFSYRFASRRSMADAQEKEYEKEFKNRPLNALEYERKVCRQTVKIRSLRKSLKTQPAVSMKLTINTNLYKRMKFLNELYKLDRPAHNRLVEKLKIDFKAPLPFYVEYPHFERKRDIRRVCDEYCDNMKDEKLSEYREKIKLEKIKFDEEKKEKLKWIEEQVKRFNLTDDMLEEPKTKLLSESFVDPE
ncbi:28S ribosomal protein S15, mitochondrial isoform X2 [Brevipalpus obovatus]|uniref:28S ribosomal protein S15, mitochondrial isoform X2 n=1 Tax=Brevipalpus obovatus TaxID=246614 RepID=UPI003D9F9256